MSRRTRAGRKQDEAGASAAVRVRVAAAAFGSLSQTVRLLGTVEALPNQRAQVAAQLAGQITSLRVKRGDAVHAGQVLATIYNADLAAEARRAQAAEQGAQQESAIAQAEVAREREAQEAQLRQARASLKAAQARLDKLRAGSRAEEIAEAEAALAREQAELQRLEHGSRPEEVDQAEASLRAEEAELAKLKAGPRPQEIAQAEAAVRDAEAHRQTARNAATRARALYEDGLASGRETEAAEAELAAAESHWQTATEQLKLLREGTRPEDIRAQEARVAEAEAAVRLAHSGPRTEEIAAQRAAVEEARQRLRKLRAGARPEELREAEADLEQAQANLARTNAARWRLQIADLEVKSAGTRAQQATESRTYAEASVSKSRITAPMSGVIADVFANQGEVTEAGTPLLEIVNADALRVIAWLAARYQGAVVVGMPAHVSLPHVAGATYDTTLSVVGVEVDETTGLVPVELMLPSPGADIRDGMAAEVSLTLTSHPGALVIPASAVFARAAENYVYVIDDSDTVHERMVDIGIEQDDRVEIAHGLSAGERVAVIGTASLADGLKVVSDS